MATTIGDLIDEFRAAGRRGDSGHRLAAALSDSGPVIHGLMIYSNNSHPDRGWQIVIRPVPDIDRLMPWAVRLGLRDERPGDVPGEMALCRRYHLPVARVVPVAARGCETC